MADKRAGRGEQAVTEIRRCGGDAIFVGMDVTDAAAVQGLVERSVTHYGRLDLAFNNAGIPGEAMKPLAQQSEASWDEVIAVNLKGVWMCMRQQIPRMLQGGGGAIVNNASYLGLAGAEYGVSPYAASKHGVIGLTRTAAVEYARLGVRVNAVCPSFTRTEMMAPALAAPGGAFAAFVDAAVPMGRIAGPEEVAGAVLWLLGPEAGYVTGHALVVDGGRLAK
jgi:NAD(P)-dependent dehydrogenase (short-subunit alcohol dehydrogenase family)